MSRPVSGLRFRVSGLFLCLLLLSACTTVDRQDNTARLLQHPQFRAAAQSAPEWVTESLQTITRLEEQLARRPN